MIFRLSKLQFTHWAWLLPILMFTTVMISIHLTTDAYWGDEAVTLRSMGVPPYPSRSLDGIIFEVGVTHWPPAYFLVLDGWVFAGIWLNRDLSYMQGLPSGATLFPIETMQYTTSIAKACVQSRDTINR